MQRYNEDHLAFIKEKIEEIKIALFKAEINSALQLPNNIVEIFKVEKDGTLWFITSCSGDHAKTIDRSFYAYLDFYKKGTGCRLQLSGGATIAEDDHDIFLSLSDYSKTLGGRLVLIKMKIMQAEYFENKMKPAGSLKNKCRMIFYQLFLSNPHKSYHFS